MRTALFLKTAIVIVTLVLAATVMVPREAAAQQSQPKARSHSIITIDPATPKMRKTLNAISPALAAAARWQQADAADDGTMTAQTVVIDVPWRESRLTADQLTIDGDRVDLKGVHLQNGRGTFDAGEVSGPVSTFRALAAFTFAGGGGASAPAEGNAGALHISDFKLAAKPRQRGEARFSSFWRGRSLEIGGLHCATSRVPAATCDFLGLDRLAAKQLDAKSNFAGTARLRMDSITFSMSGAGKGAWPDPALIVSAFTRRPGVAGKAIGGELKLSKLHLTASRASLSETSSTIDIASARFALDRRASGGVTLAGELSSRFSSDVLKGTRLWPAIKNQTGPDVGSGGDLIPLTAKIDASFDDGALALPTLTADIAGLLTLDASTHMSGLKTLLDHAGHSEDSDTAAHGLSQLMGIAISSFSLVMHDHGFSNLVEAAFGASPAELVRAAAGPSGQDSPNGTGADGKSSPDSGSLMSLMMNGSDMKSGLKTIVRSVAVKRISAILDKLRHDGSVDLQCTSTPTCIALAIGSQN